MPALLAVISHCRFNCQPDTSPWRCRPSESSLGTPEIRCSDHHPGFCACTLYWSEGMRAGYSCHRPHISTQAGQTTVLMPPPLPRQAGLTTVPARRIASQQSQYKIVIQWFSEIIFQYIMDPSFHLESQTHLNHCQFIIFVSNSLVHKFLNSLSVFANSLLFLLSQPTPPHNTRNLNLRSLTFQRNTKLNLLGPFPMF